jgi:hypothetical protein
VTQEVAQLDIAQLHQLLTAVRHNRQANIPGTDVNSTKSVVSRVRVHVQRRVAFRKVGVPQA